MNTKRDPQFSAHLESLVDKVTALRESNHNAEALKLAVVNLHKLQAYQKEDNEVSSYVWYGLGLELLQLSDKVNAVAALVAA